MRSSETNDGIHSSAACNVLFFWCPATTYPPHTYPPTHTHCRLVCAVYSLHFLLSCGPLGNVITGFDSSFFGLRVCAWETPSTGEHVKTDKKTQVRSRTHEVDSLHSHSWRLTETLENAHSHSLTYGDSLRLENSRSHALIYSQCPHHCLRTPLGWCWVCIHNSTAIQQ